MAGQTAHHKDPRTLGMDVVPLLADALAHNRPFLDALAHARPLTFEGTVTATQRDATGVNKVQIKRTGKPSADGAWYTVYAPMHVPIAGDQYRLLQIGPAAVIVVAVMNGGRPDEQTIPYATGSHRRYDAGRKLIKKDGDDHGERRYDTDGVRLAHYRGAAGEHAQTGDRYSGPGDGSMVVSDTGTVTGFYSREQHAGAEYQHNFNPNDGHGERLIRTHTHLQHSHYLDTSGAGSVSEAHRVALTASSTGAFIGLKVHGSGNFHEFGDDGTANPQIVHGLMGGTGGSASTAWTHNGAGHLFSTWISGTGAVQTGKHLPSGSGGTWHAKAHGVAAEHVWGDDGTAKLQEVHGGIPGGGGQIRLDDGITEQFSRYIGGTGMVLSHKRTYTGSVGAQYHARQSGAAAFHVTGDDGSGNHLVQSVSATHKISVSSGASTHTHTANGHTHPSTAQENAPATDSSRIDVKAGNGDGAVRVPSHYAPAAVQTVPTGTITTTPASVTYTSSGSSTDLHFKVATALVYDNANPGGSNYGNNYGVAGWNSGFGGKAFSGSPAALNNNVFWATSFTDAAGGLQIVIRTTSGTYSGTLAVQLQVVGA